MWYCYECKKWVEEDKLVRHTKYPAFWLTCPHCDSNKVYESWDCPLCKAPAQKDRLCRECFKKFIGFGNAVIDEVKKAYGEDNWRDNLRILIKGENIWDGII